MTPIPGFTVTLPRTVLINRAAELMSVSRRTIYNWIQSGKIATVRTAAGTQRVVTESLWRIPTDSLSAQTNTGDSPQASTAGRSKTSSTDASREQHPHG